jgi:hypothetical protein
MQMRRGVYLFVYTFSFAQALWQMLIHHLLGSAFWQTCMHKSALCPYHTPVYQDLFLQPFTVVATCTLHVQRTIQAFLYTGLVGALALPMTLTTAMKVAFGSKWLVALRRAQAAGKMLAMQLAQVRLECQMQLLVMVGCGLQHVHTAPLPVTPS